MDKDFLKICNEKTLQTTKEGFFNTFVQLVKENVGENWINRTFSKLTSDKQRFKIIYEYEPAKKIIKSVLLNVRTIYRGKNEEIAQKRLSEAENLHRKSTNNKIKLLSLYSQSILKATNFGETLALAYWGRSALLIDINEYSYAINDVKLSQKYGLPNRFKADIFCRLALCYRRLGDEKRAQISLDLADKLMNNKDKIEAIRKIEKFNEKSNKTNTELPEIKGGINKQYKSASKKLTVKTNNEIGRYFVAKKQIQTGEALVVERPYAACLLPEKFSTNCHNCFQKLIASIPCTSCSSIAFCSIECRDLALNSYHKYECKFLDLLIGSGMSELTYLALRMITQFDLKQVLNKDNQEIYKLCTNSSKRNAQDFFQRTLMAAFLLKCLQKAKYFGEDDANLIPTEEEELKIGELLLFNLQMLQFNAHEIFETIQDPTTKLFKNNTIALGIYPTSALFNHDCYPAVIRYFIGKNIIIKSIRPLNINDIIVENYGPIFTVRDLAQRQKYLYARYWFQCKCLACKEDWPNFQKNIEYTKRVRCPNSNCPYLFSLPLKTSLVKCPKCEQEVNVEENVLILNECEEQYKNGIDLLKNNVKQAMDIFCMTLDKFHSVSAPPHKQTHFVQEYLKNYWTQ